MEKLKGVTKLIETTHGSIVPGGYVKTPQGQFKVKYISGDRCYYPNGSSDYLKDVKLIKLYVVDDNNNVLGELAYKSYANYSPNCTVEGTIVSAKSKATVGEQVTISSIPLSQFKEEFDAVYKQGTLTGTITAIDGDKHVVNTACGNCVVKRRSIVLQHRQDEFNIFVPNELT